MGTRFDSRFMSVELSKVSKQVTFFSPYFYLLENGQFVSPRDLLVSYDSSELELN